MNKIFYILILSFIGLSANAMHRIAACKAIQGGTIPKRTMMSTRSHNNLSAEEIGCRPLFKALREGNYEEMLRRLPKSPCYDSCRNCCFQEFIDLEEELKKKFIIIQAVKIHHQKLLNVVKIEPRKRFCGI